MGNRGADAGHRPGSMSTPQPREVLPGSLVPAHLAVGSNSPFLARDSALTDTPERLAQRLLERLYPGERPLHRQGVIGMKRAPGGRQAPVGLQSSLLEQLPCSYKPGGQALRASGQEAQTHPAVLPIQHLVGSALYQQHFT